MQHRIVIAAALSLLVAADAQAGITDPPPSGFIHVWTIPGVMQNLNVGTAFVCTATDTNNVSVEVFDAAGTLQSNGASASMNVGESRTFVTQSLPNLVSQQNLGVNAAFQGSARVIAASSKLICAALLMDTSGYLIAELPVLKKNKQKGN